jgi:hypothetical protein
MRPKALLVLVLALAAAAAVPPGVARADDPGGVVTTNPGTVDDLDLVEFNLPDRRAIDKLLAVNADLAEYVRDEPDGTITVQAFVTPAQKADYEAMGFPATGIVSTPETAAATLAERSATLAREKDAFANLQAGRDVADARGKSKALAADTVQVMRADYFTNYAGRFISIEAYTSAGSKTSNQNPTMTASWDSGPGTAITSGGSGTLSPFIDTDPPDNDYYLYHRNLFRVGNNGDGKPMPSTVRVASSNGGVDTLAVKPWVSQNGSGAYPAGFQKDFVTHYTDSQEDYAKIRALAAEFPNISEIINLPNKSPGYQRYSQAIVGTATPYNPQITSLSSAGTVGGTDQPRAVVLTSKSFGQNGGNSQSIQLLNPNAGNSPLTVSVADKAIAVRLATGDTGAITSTAAQVVAAINASADASALMKAETYRNNAGTGIVTAAAAPTMLSDFLKAPASVPRGPAQVQAIRIGAHRDGSKVGVFFYCQEHAREWVVPLVCLETAERLLRNYGTDPETTELVDNLDIYILPSVNADGANYTLYDFNSQRKNMVNYCGTNRDDPTSRNTWGVDLNRNFSVGSIFDGYVGASSDCTNEVYAGPFELSEPEIRNELWLTDQHPNIKLSNNIHSSGGYFMWSPAAYKNVGREALPYPSYGVSQYFQQAADRTLDRIKSYRGTVITPARTGPVADVLYSAAGNSSDEAYYNRGILAYDFEVGADRFNSTTSGTSQTGVGFFPTFNSEGHDEAMEFSDGNYALLDSALDYSRDTTAPDVTTTVPGGTARNAPFDVDFNESEPADIHYTTDGSTPTLSSPIYGPDHIRGRPVPVHVTTVGTTTVKWIAQDIKKNTSAIRTATYVLDVTAPTIAIAAPLDGATFTQGRPIAADYTCTDAVPGVADCVGSVPAGALIDTAAPGPHTFTVTAHDGAGNAATVVRSYTVIPAVNTNGNVGGTVGATLALTLSSPAAFGAFTPGLTKDYNATMTATVVSTAGDGALSVADPSAAATGHLVNGAFSLPSVLQAKAMSAAGTGGGYANVAGSAAPVTLLTYTGPTSNDAVTLAFLQHIGSTDALRTGAYAKTLTFTLSTTTP